MSELHIAKYSPSTPNIFRLHQLQPQLALAGTDPQAGHWCGTCPKCAFAFALLAAWLPEPTVSTIFGRNLFDNPALRPLYRQLWGVEGFKPFECVGTPEETQAAWYLAAAKPGFANTALMTDFKRDIQPKLQRPDALVQGLLTPELGLADPASRWLLEQAGVSKAVAA